ncbi:DUF1868 domain-containing protein, partial [bacterium]|nr:DUF1868 domain-containing protein [bacterium]
KSQYITWWQDLKKRAVEEFNEEYVQKLINRWHAGKQNSKRDNSSGYGISVVAFVSPETQLHQNILDIQERLKQTQAYKNKKLIFNPPQKLHLTIFGLMTGQARLKRARLKGKGAGKISRKAVRRLRAVFKRALSESRGIGIKLSYENDITISPSARINVLGFFEDAGLQQLRRDIWVALEEEFKEELESEPPDFGIESPKGEDISVATISKELTPEEFKEIKSVIDDLRHRFQKPESFLGNLITDKVTFVQHSDDLLEDTKEEITINIVKGSSNVLDKNKKRLLRRFWSRWIGGIVISLFICTILFGAGGDVMNNVPQVVRSGTFEFPLGLGVWGILACAIAVIGARAIYQQVSLARTGLVEVEQVGLPQVLGLEAVWQALVPLFEGGRGFVAAIFRQPSKRAELRMSWLGPQEELPELREKEIMRRAKELREGRGIARVWVKGHPHLVNPAANPWLIWRSPHEGMGREITEIGEFATSVREEYENVVVIGRAEPFAKVRVAIREKSEHPQVYALESAHPEAINEIEGRIN